MKKYLLACFLSLSIVNAYADFLVNYPHDTVNRLTNFMVVKLNNVENNTLNIHVSYPGAISERCSLYLRTPFGENFKSFMDSVVIEPSGATLSRNAAEKGSVVYKLSQGGFLGGFVIKTKDGHSFADNIARTLSTSSATGKQIVVAIMQGPCYEAPVA